MYSPNTLYEIRETRHKVDKIYSVIAEIVQSHISRVLKRECWRISQDFPHQKIEFFWECSSDFPTNLRDIFPGFFRAPKLIGSKSNNCIQLWIWELKILCKSSRRGLKSYETFFSSSIPLSQLTVDKFSHCWKAEEWKKIIQHRQQKSILIAFRTQTDGRKRTIYKRKFRQKNRRHFHKISELIRVFKKQKILQKK